MPSSYVYIPYSETGDCGTCHSPILFTDGRSRPAPPVHRRTRTRRERRIAQQDPPGSASHGERGMSANVSRDSAPALIASLAGPPGPAASCRHPSRGVTFALQEGTPVMSKKNRVPVNLVQIATRLAAQTTLWEPLIAYDPVSALLRPAGPGIGFRGLAAHLGAGAGHRVARPRRQRGRFRHRPRHP